MDKRTIFLSHSHKDIDKVRTIRGILESLDFEPLMFYLRCLDDRNDELEDFIKREIEARNVFIYCKSSNSEQSTWVQKELEYIKQSDIRRLHTIDIGLPLNQTLATLLESLSKIIKRNSVFLSCSRKDLRFCTAMEKLLTDYGFNAFCYKTVDTKDEHDKQLREIIKNESGIFIPIITRNFMNSVYCKAELEAALDYGNKTLIIPLAINYSLQIATTLIPHLYDCRATYEFTSDGNIEEKDKVKIISILQNMTID